MTFDLIHAAPISGLLPSPRERKAIAPQVGRDQRADRVWNVFREFWFALDRPDDRSGTGFAIANEQSLWIDPMDYRESLSEGVHILAATGMTVSVYNLPRCVLDVSIWPHAVQSISDWKNGYTEECNKCVEKSRCGGLFTSGRPRWSRGIAAIQ
ncbi:hypothetical protein AAFG13_34675 [Bradyrhizobium sp. B124]|uniref:hypothetical protein n=1 Tax=Bradyrhizobium sp. B124 TaxID=3140245 RepID=UPI0031845687